MQRHWAGIKPATFYARVASGVDPELAATRPGWGGFRRPENDWGSAGILLSALQGQQELKNHMYVTSIRAMRGVLREF